MLLFEICIRFGIVFCLVISEVTIVTLEHHGACLHMLCHLNLDIKEKIIIEDFKLVVESTLNHVTRLNFVLFQPIIHCLNLCDLSTHFIRHVHTSNNQLSLVGDHFFEEVYLLFYLRNRGIYYRFDILEILLLRHLVFLNYNFMRLCVTLEVSNVSVLVFKHLLFSLLLLICKSHIWF